MIGNDHVRFGRGPSGKGQHSWHLARRPTSRKLRGKDLVIKPGRTRRYQIPGPGAAPIAALLTLRDRSSAPSSPVSAGPRLGRKPATWPASTATTRRSASTCRPSSATSHHARAAA